MVSKAPIVKQYAWISTIPQLAVMGLLIFIYYLAHSRDPIIHGALTYLAISFCLRTFIPKDHRKGMDLVRQKRYAEAIPFFKSSYAFFTRNLWIDKYRYLTLFSSSAISYREMALNNIAFCYSQSGQGKESEEAYKKVLEEFPDSGMAETALKMIHSAKQARDE